jgi:hypothetical protein
MVVLALVFNDLKGLSLAMHELGLEPRSKAADHPLASQGQVSGLAIQFARFIGALIFELLSVLKDERTTVESSEMAELVGRLPAKERRSWDAIISVAFDRQPSSGPTGSTWKMLVKLRNKVSFHYDPETIGRGYRHHFFESPGKAHTDRAVFSNGRTMESSRFFFADAAAEEGIRKLTDLSSQEAAARIGKLSEQVNLALKPLVIEYMKTVGKAAPYGPTAKV